MFEVDFEVILEGDLSWRRRACSLWEGSVRIAVGTIDDYVGLARFHYRAGMPVAVVRVFVARMGAANREMGDPGGGEVIGVLVETRPVLNCAGRNVAVGGRYVGMGKSEAARAINREMRTIARVVVVPRFRGMGVAGALVRHTLSHAETEMVGEYGGVGGLSPVLGGGGDAGVRGGDGGGWERRGNGELRGVGCGFGVRCGDVPGGFVEALWGVVKPHGRRGNYGRWRERRGNAALRHGSGGVDVGSADGFVGGEGGRERAWWWGHDPWHPGREVPAAGRGGGCLSWCRCITCGGGGERRRDEIHHGGHGRDTEDGADEGAGRVIGR